MSEPAPETVSLFKENAAKAGTIVTELAGLQQAIEYALNLCRPAGPGILAVPGLPESVLVPIRARAEQAGVSIVREKLRACPNSIAVGFTLGDVAVADTASVIMSSPGEDSRLASMLSEIHVIAVPKSKILASSYEAESYLRDVLSGVMYTTFISGCSRTSDIERVLTLGVHGPLELHVTLLTEA